MNNNMILKQTKHWPDLVMAGLADSVSLVQVVCWPRMG